MIAPDSQLVPAAPPDFRSGFVGIVGRPNVGKSTLVNALIGQKIAITSPIAQTTRNCLRGILTTATAQIILVDTPGIHKPHHELGKVIVRNAQATLNAVDVILFLVDRSVPPGGGDRYIADLLVRTDTPVLLGLNKADCPLDDPDSRDASYIALAQEAQQKRQNRESAALNRVEQPSPNREPRTANREPLSAAPNRVEQPFPNREPRTANREPLSAAPNRVEQPFPNREPRTANCEPLSPNRVEQPFPNCEPRTANREPLIDWPALTLCALSGEGLDTLQTALSDRLDPGPYYYPPDLVTDQPERFIIAELIREQILHHTRQEVPHSVAIAIDIVEPEPEITRILATINVERQSQKGILIGKRGQMLKAIGTAARQQIQTLIASKIYLELFVRVQPQWRQSRHHVAEFGYRRED